MDYCNFKSMLKNKYNIENFPVVSLRFQKQLSLLIFFFISEGFLTFSIYTFLFLTPVYLYRMAYMVYFLLFNYVPLSISPICQPNFIVRFSRACKKKYPVCPF